MRHTGLAVTAFVGLLSVAAPARAELVFFDSGRTLSVKGHRTEGDVVIMTLRSGGEASIDRSLISRIAPDEVPYPEPEEVPATLDATATASGGGRLQADPRYNEMIDTVAARHGVDATLVKALIKVESNYRQRARSRKGAMGLMQLMPETARQYAVADPYDPRANIEGGIKYLKSLLDRFPTTLALAAYNAGEGAVQRFGGVPPYAETRLYVSRILDLVGR